VGENQGELAGRGRKNYTCIPLKKKSFSEKEHKTQGVHPYPGTPKPV
jgi:hypothetical protein